MNLDMRAILSRAAEKAGVDRVRFQENKIPTAPSNITILPFFGDLRSMAVLSTYILRRYREEIKGSKYFILCTWPGFESLFPYVDEVWTVKPDLFHGFYGASQGFLNNSEQIKSIIRNLNYFFEEVIDPKDLIELYNNGFTQTYLEKFRNFKRFLPSISSSTVLGMDFNRDLTRKGGNKVVIFPSRFLEIWDRGRLYFEKIVPEFWTILCKRLLSEGYTPVVVQNSITHDISSEVGNQAIYVNTTDMGAILAAVRTTGCLLDIFGGMSRYSLIARTPFVCCDQRTRFSEMKETEFEDLMGGQFLPAIYIYSFPTIITSGSKDSWNDNFIDLLIVKLNEIFQTMDRDKWPSTGESYEIVLYNRMRDRVRKKFGTRFIKVPSI